MRCQVCGGVVMVDQRFCSACGTRVDIVPPVSPVPPGMGAAGYGPRLAPVGRVERHVQTLGILWCVYGGLRLGMGLIGMFVLRTMTMRRFGSEGWPFGGPLHPFPSIWMNAFIPVIAAVTVLATALALLTGYALLTRRTWGRMLAMVAGVLTLIKIPLGTALGVYTLWVLAPVESRLEYGVLADLDESG